MPIETVLLRAHANSKQQTIVEPLAGDDGTVREYARFTFERYSDHRIGSRLLDQYLTLIDPKASFAVGTPLYEFVTGPNASILS